MPNIIDRRDLEFILYDLLRADRLFAAPVFADITKETCAQILDAAERLAEEKFQSHAAKSDANEPRYVDGRAITIPEIKEALDAFVEAGFMGARFDAEDGGLQIPFVVASAVSAIFGAANGPTFAYAMLTQAAAALIGEHGDAVQKQKYMHPLVEGRWFGTMCLSEPQAGSSLADIRTRAELQADGSYRVIGGKMWISGGEQEISENIVHMVLARISGAPAGVRGISLFIVPKFLVDDEGQLGERNDITLNGLNHKMGNRGTTNTVLSFGDRGGATAYLVGEPNAGLAYMFKMMNEARIAVGTGAAALGCTGYLHALEYAKTRLQGRRPDEKDPEKPMVPLLEHADVKRMLLQQKAYAEGALALCLYAARMLDELRCAPEEERERDALHLDFLTPIVKSWPSEFCLRANEQAIQVHGGYGYTRDFPVERFFRDNRLNPIHEGTKGVQGIDLLGRKVRMKSGAALRDFDDRLAATIRDAKTSALQAEAEALEQWRAIAMATTSEMLEHGEKKGDALYLANATTYLDMMGHLSIAWIWLRMAMAAQARLQSAKSQHERDFLTGKLVACRYFYRYEAPAIEGWCALLRKLDATCLDAPIEIF